MERPDLGKIEPRGDVRPWKCAADKDDSERKARTAQKACERCVPWGRPYQETACSEPYDQPLPGASVDAKDEKQKGRHPAVDTDGGVLDADGCHHEAENRREHTEPKGGEACGATSACLLIGLVWHHKRPNALALSGPRGKPILRPEATDGARSAPEGAAGAESRRPSAPLQRHCWAAASVTFGRPEQPDANVVGGHHATVEGLQRGARPTARQR